MNLHDFYFSRGREETESVAIAAGTNWAYAIQLIYNHRRPSPDLAKRLVDASDGELSFEELLTTPRRTPKPRPKQRTTRAKKAKRAGSKRSVSRRIRGVLR